MRQNLLTAPGPEISGVGSNVFGGVIILCLLALAFVVILILIVRSYKSKTNLPTFSMGPDNGDSRNLPTSTDLEKSLANAKRDVEAKQKAVTERTSERSVADKALVDAQSAATAAEQAAAADPTNVDKQTASNNAKATVVDKQTAANAAKQAVEKAESEYAAAKQRADNVEKQLQTAKNDASKIEEEKQQKDKDAAAAAAAAAADEKKRKDDEAAAAAKKKRKDNETAAAAEKRRKDEELAAAASINKSQPDTKRNSTPSATPTDFEVVNLENVAVGNPSMEYNTDANPINTQRARRYIAKKDKLNANLKNYVANHAKKRNAMFTPDADPETDDDVNVVGVWESVSKNSTDKLDANFENWQTSSENFRTLCSIMLDSIRFIHTKDGQEPEFGKPSTDEHRVVAKIYADRFMQDIIDKRSVIAKNPSLPWGTEWYDFGVNLTAVIAQYLLLPDCKFQTELSEIILLLIPNPQFVCGKQRKNYASLLLGPWFMANYHLNQLKDAVKSSDYKKARQSVIAKIQRKPFARGLHLDGSYFAHDPPVPAYTVLKETFNEKSMYYYYLDTSLTNAITYNNIWHIPMRLICHPTIALGNTGMFGRPTTNLGYIAGGESNPKYRAPLGLAVLPFSRFLRYYTADRMFSVRGQDTRMGFIHADPQTVYNSRFWVQSRVVYTDKDVEKPFALPWPGLTKRTDLQQLPNEDPTFPELESVGPIAPPASFVVNPKEATSFVMRYLEFGVFYNNYDITTFENSVNRELIVVNATKQTIDMYHDIINKEYTADIEYFLQDNTKVVIPRMVPPRDLEVTSIHQTINLYGATVRNQNPKAIAFPIKLSDSLEIRDFSSTSLGAYVLYDSGKPKVVAFTSLDSELNEMTMKIDNVATKIKFDFDTNQYVVADTVAV